MIELTTRDRVAVITLQRPEKRNALTVELCDRLRAAVHGATAGTIAWGGASTETTTGVSTDESSLGGDR